MEMFKKKVFFTWCLLALGVFWTPALGPAPAAAAFPEKPITLICPWPPGGSSDLIVRTIAKLAPKYFPKPVVVINRAGANGVVATTENVRTSADGYTILIGTSGLFTATPLSQKNLGYKQDDFEFLAGMTNEPMIFTVPTSAPYKSLNELIKTAKEKDLVIRYSNSGLGGIPQLCAAQLFRLARVKSQPVPFKGGGPAVTAILGAHVDVGVSHPGEALPHIQAGKLRGLGISSLRRFPGLPDVPTLAERGYDIDIGVKKYIFAPKGLPNDVRKYLADNLGKIIREEEFRTTMTNMAILYEPMTGKEVVDYLNGQYPIMKKLIEETSALEKKD
jgi:tripartite-type tricarboxylate transporter receptor subunit TctC